VVAVHEEDKRTNSAQVGRWNGGEQGVQGAGADPSSVSRHVGW
jgi:hypothetical protein